MYLNILRQSKNIYQSFYLIDTYLPYKYTKFVFESMDDRVVMAQLATL